MEVVLATANDHKIKELRAILSKSGWFLRTGKDFSYRPNPEENGVTYEENALIKARAWAAATGLPALADDSGLEVDALDGRPGLHSARYAPTADQRIDRLLEALKNVKEADRTARFVCHVALVWPDGRERVARGVCEGRIGFERAGEEGFGYDPVFLVDERPGRTMAELPMGEKNKVSHRARAIARLLEEMRS
jgi:XTP/dITP diphosphohydrolase